MTYLSKPARAAAGLCAALTLAACGGGGGSDNATGRISLAITDAPVDGAAEVWVQFTGIELKPSGGESIDFTFDTPVDIDLLTLTGETSATLLNGETVPAGPYNWVALRVNAEFDGVFDSYVVPLEGGMVEVRVPSGAQSGLRLVSGFTVTANQNTSFVIDWDLLKGLTNPVGQEGYFLRPALRITDMTEYGSISGTVADGLVMDAGCANNLADETGNLVYVYEGADVTPVDIDGADPEPLTTARVSTDPAAAGAYTYSATFLSPGDYTVAFTCQGLNEDPEADDGLVFVQAQNANVADDQDTQVNFD